MIASSAMNAEPNSYKIAAKHMLGQEVHILNPNETTREAEINCQNYLAKVQAGKMLLTPLQQKIDL